MTRTTADNMSFMQVGQDILPSADFKSRLQFQLTNNYQILYQHMRILIFIIVYIIAPKYFMGQEPIFKEDGRMRQNFLQVDTLITTKIKYNTNEIEFKRIDSIELLAEKPFREILEEFYNARKSENVELFYLFNGTDSSIELHTHGRSLISVLYALAANKTLKPISFHIYPSCGVGCRDIIIKKGDLLMMQNDLNEQMGYYKTKVQVRVLTLSKKKIFSSFFTTSIDNNSFYLDPKYEREYSYMKRYITFLD